MDSMTAIICCSVIAHRLPRVSPAKVRKNRTELRKQLNR